MKPTNLGDIKYGLEHGIGVFAGVNRNAYSLQPDGSVLDCNGQQILVASSEGKAIYDAFTGDNGYALPLATTYKPGGICAEPLDAALSDSVEYCQIDDEEFLCVVLPSTPPVEATTTQAGVVKMCSNQTTLNGLINAMISAGMMQRGVV